MFAGADGKPSDYHAWRSTFGTEGVDRPEVKEFIQDFRSFLSELLVAEKYGWNPDECAEDFRARVRKSFPRARVDLVSVSDATSLFPAEQPDKRIAWVDVYLERDVRNVGFEGRIRDPLSHKLFQLATVRLIVPREPTKAEGEILVGVLPHVPEEMEVCALW